MRRTSALQSNFFARAQAPHARGARFLVVFLGSILAALAAGCGSASNTHAGAISVTDPTSTVTGQLKSLAVGHTAALSMTPVNDSSGAGIDWAVTCGGSPLNGSITGGACGSFSPTHTPDGAKTVFTAPSQVPIGTTVTITAAVTNDPSATSTVTLTVLPPAIVISFSGAPPTSLVAGSTASITAQLVNDTTGAGVMWTATCSDGTTPCGSFDPTTTVSFNATTYSAPAAVPGGGTATITATSVADSTRTLSTTVTILPIPTPVTVTLSSPTFTVGKKLTVSLVGAVANDATSAGLTWTVTCAASNTTGNCGSVTPTKTASGGVVVYRAPTTEVGVNPIVVTATAAATAGAAAPSTGVAMGTVIAGTTIGVTVTAKSTALVPLATTALTASVQNDATNAGVTWAATCGDTTAGACGTISNQAGSGSTYTAAYTAPATIPAGGSVTISANPNAANATANPPIPDNPGLLNIAVVAVSPTIAFLQTPPATLTAGGQVPVSAAVTNDVAPGGVTWTTRCGSTAAGACGYVQAYQTANGVSAIYFAPPIPPTGTASGLKAGQVAIVATSTATPTVSKVSTAVTITPNSAITTRFVPFAPSQVQAGATVNLQAAAVNDASNAGVDWQVCSSGCGFFTTTPAIAAIAATPTTPFVPAVPAVTATSVSGWPNNLPIPYTAPPAANSFTINALSHADNTSSAIASVTVTTQATGPAVTGHVLSGAQPIMGASVSLYVAGTTGYGSQATLLYSPQSTPSATTAADGSFTIAAGYTCPAATSQAYLIASGGTVGAFTFNTNLTLMSALGSCGNLSSTPVVVNEVTTIASAWPLARFASNDELSGNSSYLYLGTDSANTAGLANAFAGVNNLVDVTTGQALFSVPTGNATVPYAEINTLADILNTCTASAGGVEGDGSSCGTLFTATDELSANPTYNPTSPADTVQAAFNIAQHPGSTGFLNYSLSISTQLLALATPGSPFQPILNTTPVDFSISLNYTGGGGLSKSSSADYFALDATGNLWITDAKGNSIIEWNSTGTPASPAAGFTAPSLTAPGPVAIDPAGNLWVCDSNGLTELTGLATEEQGSPFIGGGVTGTCQGSAFDGLGNLWVSNANSVSKFTNLGVPLSPSTGYTIANSPTDPTKVSLLPPIAIDESNNVWVGVSEPGSLLYLAELNNGTGAPNYLNGPPTGSDPFSNAVILNADSTQTQIAINAAGDVFVPSSSTNQALTEVSPFAGPGTTDVTSAAYAPASSQGVNPLTEARGVAIDGAGLIWVGTTQTSAIQEGGLVEISTLNSTTRAEFAYYASPSLSNRAIGLAVDGSGNIWALLDNNTITEFVGLGTPAVTPLALAVNKKKLGAQP